MSKEITIPYETYINLSIDSEILYTLERAGVDNWNGYGCNCDIIGEEECIFCTEDEANFLERNRL